MNSQKEVIKDTRISTSNADQNQAHREYLETRRAALLMELRCIDKQLGTARHERCPRCEYRFVTGERRGEVSQ